MVRAMEYSNEMLLDVKIARLGFLQTIINRMGLNSFLLKGWTVTLSVAMSALPAKGGSAAVLLFCVGPVLVFWWLDAYYLHHERLYRTLYNEVALSEALDATFDLSPGGIRGSRPSRLDALFSRRQTLFYGMVLIILIVLRLLTFQ